MTAETTNPDRIYARYWIETAFPLDFAAATMAGEQSTGTFVRVPGETDELRERYAARVERIEELGTVDAPSLSGSALPNKLAGPVVRRTAEVTLSWPIENMGPSLPNLLATVAGNLFELKPFSGLKLIDVTLPLVFLTVYRGPQFGVEGTRRLTGVYVRPVIGTIIKPSVGMTPEQTAAQVKMLIEAGVDFIKDDELQSDGPHCPFDQRVPAVLRVIEEFAQRTGRRPMYAANITGEIDQMLRRHDLVVSLRWNLRHGQRKQCRLARDDRAEATHAGCHSRPSQRLGHVQPVTCHWHELHRLPEVLAARRYRSHPCKRLAQQILRRRRQRDCIRPRMSHSHVSGGPQRL